MFRLGLCRGEQPHGVGHRFEPVYGPDALGGFDPAADLGRPGEFPFTRGVYPSMYIDPAVDDAAVRRVRHRGGVQRPLSGADRPRHRRVVGGLRPAHPDGLRLRRPGCVRRGRQGRGGDRLAGGHAAAVRGHPAGRGLDLDDHQRAGRGAAAALPAGGRGAGRRAGPADRHDPERRAQGVHRPRHLHLPAAALAAPGQRHLRVLPGAPAALEHHLDLRLSHGRGRGDAGAGGGVHPGQRDRLRRGGAGRRAGGGRVRAPAVVLLRRPDHAAGGGGEVPGRPADLGPADAGTVRRDRDHGR